jgi:hypothetical protein
MGLTMSKILVMSITTHIHHNPLKSKYLPDALLPVLVSFTLQDIITKAQQNQVGMELNGSHQHVVDAEW